MDQAEVLALFRNAGALLEGHFLLSSGLHSGHYLQAALVLQQPERAAMLGSELARRMIGMAEPVEFVIAPALGGILVGHEVARALGVRSLFAEREAGVLKLRRGFHIAPGERGFVVEDVITTGRSTRETIHVVEESGGTVIAAGSLVDRSAGKTEWDIPRIALATLDIPTFKPEDCPSCRSGSMPIKPGSR